MKKLSLFFVVIFAFTLIACAQNTETHETSVSNESNINYTVLKAELIAELKTSDNWDYEESHKNRINIVPKSYKTNSYMGTVQFQWEYKAPSEIRPGYIYYELNLFKKNNETGSISPADELDRYYVRIQ